MLFVFGHTFFYNTVNTLGTVEPTIGDSDFHNLMGYSFKKMPNKIFLKKLLGHISTFLNFKAQIARNQSKF